MTMNLQKLIILTYGYNNSTLEEKGNYIDSFKDFEIK